jgi:hypothetical protein
MDRRYQLNRTREVSPSKRALWMRILFYAGILAVVVAFQQYIGRSAGNCYSVLSGPGTPPPPAETPPSP